MLVELLPSHTGGGGACGCPSSSTPSAGSSKSWQLDPICVEGYSHAPSEPKSACSRPPAPVDLTNQRVAKDRVGACFWGPALRTSAAVTKPTFIHPSSLQKKKTKKKTGKAAATSGPPVQRSPSTRASDGLQQSDFILQMQEKVYWF